MVTFYCQGVAQIYGSAQLWGSGSRTFLFLAASLTIKRKRLLVQTCRQYCVSVCLSGCLMVGRSVWRVYCGKTADSIWMPFGVVSGVGRGMGVLDGWKSLKGMDSFGGKCGTSHCNQWRLCGVVILCRKMWRRGSSQITLGFLVFFSISNTQL